MMVGNGNHIQCQGFYPHMDIHLHNTIFTIAFYLLPIEGVDVVLNIEWFRSLGPITTDFVIPSLSFTHQNTPTTLTGDSTNIPTPTFFTQLCHLLHNNSVASLHLLTFQPLSTTTTLVSLDSPLEFHGSNLNSLPQTIQNILLSHSIVFQNPYGVPLSHPHDLHIPLLLNTVHVNVKPYRYPYSQKTTITQIIQDMLDEDIIRPSTSPFFHRLYW